MTGSDDSKRSAFRPQLGASQPARQDAISTDRSDYGKGLEEAAASIPYSAGLEADISRPIYRADVEGIPTPLDSAAGETRAGKYLLTIGRTGSGKTTFHWHLLRWLFTNPDVTANAATVDERWDGSVLINSWQRLWENGQFPNSTAQHEPQEIVVEVTPQNRRLPPLQIGFFEIAGEDYRYIMPEPGRAPTIYKGLLKFLENPRIDFTIVFIADGENPEDDDILFRNALNWLDRAVTRSFADAPIMIIVSKPELALHRLQAMKHPTFAGVSELSPVQFVNEFLKGTKSAVLSRRCPFVATTMSIGSVERMASGISSIRNPDTRDIERIFKWIYGQMTGKGFGETPWQRFWRYLRDIFT